MRVKVKDQWYDGSSEPIVVQLTEQDKKNIAKMFPECTKYCEFPDGTDIKIIEKFMEIIL